jgi:prepilin-type N-terminal cleavage/methylation domain-containing protein
MVKRISTGFTLVEILIVVIILGILASIVIPQLGHATGDTKKAALSDQLHQLRIQIQLYTLQHGDNRPTLTGANWSDLTQTSTYNSANCGPYLPSVPINTLNGYTNVVVVNANPNWGDEVSGANIGFVYNPNSGVIWGTNRSGNKVYNEGDPSDSNNE